VSRHRAVIYTAVVLLVSALVPVLGSGLSDASTTTASRWPVGSTIIASSPLGPRGSPAIAVQGRKVYVVGGDRLRDGQPVKRMHDGAVFDLRTRKWKRLPHAPFQHTETTTAVWVGPNLMVFGVTCPGRVGTEHGCTGGRLVSAVYSRRTEAWRPFQVPAAFAHEGFGEALSTLTATKDEARFLVGGTTVAVNPHSGRWREIGPSVTGATCAARRYAAIFGSTPTTGLNALRLVGVNQHAWGTPALPSGFADAAIGALPSCDAHSVVVVKGDQRAQTCALHEECTSIRVFGSPFATVQRYDLASRQWSNVAPPPFPTRAGGSGVGHGSVIDFFDGTGGPAVRLSTATSTWTRLAPGPKSVRAPVWANGVYVATDDSHLVVYRPL
jgi:hypothetical protein